MNIVAKGRVAGRFPTYRALLCSSGCRLNGA